MTANQHRARGANLAAKKRNLGDLKIQRGKDSELNLYASESSITLKERMETI
jgi:hypothetical protein